MRFIHDDACNNNLLSSIACNILSCSFDQLCLTLCHPMNCRTPSFPVLHYLPECANSCPLSWWCHLTILSSVTPFSSCPQSFPASGCLPMSWLFTSGGQSICNITSVLSPSLSLTLLGGMPRWSPSPSRVSGGQSLAGTVESVLLQGDPKLVERPQCPALPFPPRITEVVALAGQSSHRLSQMTVVNF